MLQAALTRDERRRRQRSLDAIGVPSFQHMLKVSCWLVGDLLLRHMAVQDGMQLMHTAVMTAVMA